MSFKRDGDDRCLLNILRQRRVQELFSEKIPDEEAQLLSNGKIACTVCHYKPVFDTVYVLSQHRGGRKHLEYVENEKKKKQELHELILKRQHQQYLQNGSANLKLTSETHASFLNSSPYDARVKKHKVKPYNRKPAIDLSSPTIEETVSSAIDTNADNIKQSFLGHAKSSFPLAPTIFVQAEPLKPYTKKSEFNKRNIKVPMKSFCKNYGPIQTPLCIELNLAGKGSTQTASDRAITLDLEDKKVQWDTFSSKVPKNLLKTRQSSEVASSSSASTMPSGEAVTTVPVTENEFVDKGTPADVAKKKELAVKYWQVSGSGWKKDWTGKWIKDEDAEFDSDEEPPDLP